MQLFRSGNSLFQLVDGLDGLSTLYFVAVLTMMLMGNQAGLSGIRTLVARFALILAFASVMLLITELDRPGKTMMKVSQKTMIDLQASMGKVKQ